MAPSKLYRERSGVLTLVSAVEHCYMVLSTSESKLFEIALTMNTTESVELRPPELFLKASLTRLFDAIATVSHHLW